MLDEKDKIIEDLEEEVKSLKLVIEELKKENETMERE